jgi:tetratricopeptide (TPR) repeat protein
VSLIAFFPGCALAGFESFYIDKKSPAIQPAASTAPHRLPATSIFSEEAGDADELPVDAPIAFIPLAFVDDRPSLSVAAFKAIPLPVYLSEKEAATNFSNLSPASGTQTPLIPMPDIASEGQQKQDQDNDDKQAAVPALTNDSPPLPPPPPENLTHEAPPPTASPLVIPATDSVATESSQPHSKPALAASADTPQNVDLNSNPNPPIPPSPAASQVAPSQAPASEEAYSPLNSEPPQNLSEKSRAILQQIPSQLDQPDVNRPREVSIDRTRDTESLFPPPPAAVAEETAPFSKQHEAAGINIKVSNHRPNLDHELDKAYQALATGQSSLAVEIYKNVLNNDPKNKGALFGLATTYHRLNRLDQARIFYGKLLALDPQHRDGLNNFLVLLADEAPQQALEEMQKLAERNPDFSPLPAQMAIIHQRLRQYDQAIEQMFRAVALAPDNLTYRYNLAIMLDKQKKYDEAATIYRQLLEAAAKGAVLPGNLQKIQQRLTFIGSNKR